MKLFRATIKREVFILMHDETNDDEAWELAEELCQPDTNDPSPEEVTDCNLVEFVDSARSKLVPWARPHNALSVRRLILSGVIDTKVRE